MKELLIRLFRHPFLTFEILTATFFIAIFNLALPLFVMNVLNRYISHGFDGTLITLTVGMLIAVALQYGFRVSRTKMAGPISVGPDMQLSEKVLDILARARAGALIRIPNNRIQELVNGLQTVQAAYDAPSLIAVLDVPFSLLYIAAIFFLSPLLAVIAFAGILTALGVGAASLLMTRKTTKRLQELSTNHRSHVMSAVHSGDTVRAFGGRSFLSRIWNNQIKRIAFTRLQLSNRKEQSQSFILTSNLLMSVILYAVGAVYVVTGEMTIGALIGANILASRSYQNVVRFVQTTYLLSQAKQALKLLRDFMGVPLEASTGTTLKHYSGSIAFKDLAFAYPGSSGPLFQSLDLTLNPGNILVIIGRNGVGKTTMAKLIVGLLVPMRGDILVDGISLRQIAPQWWRQQIIYFPQEPTFIKGTIRENISLIYSGNEGPGLDDEAMNRIIREADLRGFLDMSQEGLEMHITEDARNLSLGMRRRLALARALATDGMLAIFDEPTEGLDADGCKAVYSVLNNLTKTGRTIIAFSNDPLIAKGAQYVLDLNEKPVPAVRGRT